MHIQRRRFLAGAAAGGTALALGSRLEVLGAVDPEKLVIDCHAHVYSEDEARYPPIANPYRPPAGKGTLAHLRREAAVSGVKHVTAIQTSSFYRFDNRFLADSSRENPDLLVGVCTLDPDDRQSPALLEKLVATSNVRGMRTIPGKSGRFVDDGVKALWSAAERLGIVINVLANHPQVDQIEELAREHRRLNLVIDHCLNLKAGDTMAPTIEALERLARLPNTHAKLTFIPTGSAEPYPCRDMHAACRRVIAAFSPRRCVWGSNFPCELWCPKVTYAQHLAIFERELGLDEPARRAILGETARRLWFERRA